MGGINMDLEGKIKTSELKPHPQNNYYFDDMEGMLGIRSCNQSALLVSLMQLL